MARTHSIEENGRALRAAKAYPWITVGLAAVLLFLVNATVSTFGVFFKPIAEEFGWSRGAVSAAIAIRFVVSAALVMPMGYLSDRYGPRRVVLPCFLLLAAGFLLTSMVTEVWHFYLVQGLVMGAGVSGPFVCLMSTVARWHDRRRGLALGLASTGPGLGIVFFPPMAAGLIAARGWQQAIAALGLLTLIIGVSASVFVKNPPLTKDQFDDRPEDWTDSSRKGRRKGPFDLLQSLPRLLRDRQLLSLFMVFALFYLGTHLVINHLVNYVTDTGIGALVAAAMMSVVGIGSIAGRLAMGPVSDRISTRADAAVCCSLVVVSLVLLMLKAEPLMWVAAALFGIGFGGAVPLIPAIIGDYFGTKNLTTMTGAIVVGTNLGSATGPWMGGFLFDLTGGYLWALVSSAVLTAIGMVVVLRLGAPTREVG